MDITCDSDGKIEKFISGDETLPLHPPDPSLGGYYVAVLFSGAYQRPLPASTTCSVARPSSVSCSTTKDGGFEIERVDLGPAADDIIGTMRYNVEEDIVTVIEKKAKEKTGVWAWAMVQPLMTKGLTTMPCLNKYKAAKTIT